MVSFLASPAVFVFGISAMSVGVLVKGWQLPGSCGGSSQSCHCSPLAARDCPLCTRHG